MDVARLAAVACGATNTTHEPKIRKATIAKIFIAEKQYSTAPNSFTLDAFTSTSTSVKPKIQIQPATAGNQKRM